MRILHVSMEIAPWAKVGGLADVVAGLPAAQHRAGDQVSVVVPQHGSGTWPAEEIRPVPGGPARIRLADAEFQVEFGRLAHPAGFEVIVVRNASLYDREGIYTPPHSAGRFPDALVRRSVLCHAALFHALREGTPPDVIHAHDAAAALAIPLLRYRFQPTPLQRARTVFSVHNLAYMEQHPLDALPYAGLPPEESYPMGPLEFWGSFSAMKAALVLADKIHVVSPTYAREILEDPEIGGPLQGVVRTRRDDVVGVVNGLDLDDWNPRRDPHIAAPYGAEDLSGRRACRRELLEIASLGSDTDSSNEGIVVGVVSRLVHQKGLDLLAAAIPELVGKGMRFAIVGTGEPDLEDEFLRLGMAFPGRVWSALNPTEEIARKVYAGSDLFCVPSRYEPCGLTQQYALLYGSVPVVRRTGGLADTVDDETGFLFENLSPGALASAIDAGARAAAHPESRLRMQLAGMGRGRSWDRVAGEIKDLIYTS